MTNFLNPSALATVLFPFLKGLANGESFVGVVVYANNFTTSIGQVTIEGEVAEGGDVAAIYVGSELRASKKRSSAKETTDSQFARYYQNRYLRICLSESPYLSTSPETFLATI